MKKTSLLIEKKNGNDKYYLLVKCNLNILNQDCDKYSDFYHQSNDYNLENSKKSYRVNLCNMCEYINDDQMRSYTNDKYNYCINIINSNNIDNDTIDRINKIRSFINSVKFNNNDYNLVESSFNDVKWFSLNEILENKDLFEKSFYNTFLKLLKNKII